MCVCVRARLLILCRLVAAVAIVCVWLLPMLTGQRRQMCSGRAIRHSWCSALHERDLPKLLLSLHCSRARVLAPCVFVLVSCVSFPAFTGARRWMTS